MLRNFSSVEEMDEHMIHKWNSVVREKDKVYHLGDVAMHHRHLVNLARCNGEKVLIKGNHDTAKLSQYAPYFKDVRGSHQFDGMLLTHIPVHPSCLYRWKHNIHGHLHSRSVMLNETMFDRRYRCVSVEHIDYTPISYEQLRSTL